MWFQLGCQLISVSFLELSVPAESCALSKGESLYIPTWAGYRPWDGCL